MSEPSARREAFDRPHPEAQRETGEAMNQLEQKILIGRSRFSTLVTEFDDENIVSRLVIKDDEGKVIAWTRCNGENEYKAALLRLSKKIKRRISYVYIVPIAAERGDENADLHVTRSRLEVA